MKILVALGVSALLLTGCSEDGWERGIYEYKAPDGSTVWCATTAGGGIDCDWNVKSGR